MAGHRHVMTAAFKFTTNDDGCASYKIKENCCPEGLGSTLLGLQMRPALPHAWCIFDAPKIAALPLSHWMCRVGGRRKSSYERSMHLTR